MSSTIACFLPLLPSPTIAFFLYPCFPLPLLKASYPLFSLACPLPLFRTLALVCLLQYLSSPLPLSNASYLSFPLPLLPASNPCFPAPLFPASYPLFSLTCFLPILHSPFLASPLPLPTLSLSHWEPNRSEANFIEYESSLGYSTVSIYSTYYFTLYRVLYTVQHLSFKFSIIYCTFKAKINLIFP